MDGKNIADFIDPDIAEKLEALEREEDKLQAEGFYDSEEDIVSGHRLVCFNPFFIIMFHSSIQKTNGKPPILPTLRNIY